MSSVLFDVGRKFVVLMHIILVLRYLQYANMQICEQIATPDFRLILRIYPIYSGPCFFWWSTLQTEFLGISRFVYMIYHILVSYQYIQIWYNSSHDILSRCMVCGSYNAFSVGKNSSSSSTENKTESIMVRQITMMKTRLCCSKWFLLETSFDV